MYVIYVMYVMYVLYVLYVLYVCMYVMYVLYVCMYVCVYITWILDDLTSAMQFEARFTNCSCATFTAPTPNCAGRHDHWSLDGKKN